MQQPLLQHPLAPYLLLWRIPGVGPMHFFKILKRFPDLSALFSTQLSQRSAWGLPEKIIQGFQTLDWEGVARDLAWMDQPQKHILLWKDAHYPSLLKEISDFPPVLFVHGDLDVLNTSQLAIVGSRKPTPSGIENTQIFTEYLSSSGLTITSGLALGIDAASHQTTLKHKGKTIAVLGTGADMVYPAAHKRLAAQIVAEGGALISEFPIGFPPKPTHFPRRNRIVSGLSLGTLVVEATLKSGSLITARLANEQGRDVFAIPGSIHNAQAKGCHSLIQQGAKLVQEPREILEELHGFKANFPTSSPLPCTCDNNFLDESHQVLLQCVGNEATSIDQLATRTGLPAQLVSAMMLQLELKGLVSAMPGGYFKI